MSPSTQRLPPPGPLLRVDPRTGELEELRFQLTVFEPGKPPRALPLVDRMIVGTHASAEVQVSDPSVSRYHLELLPRAEGVHLRDLDSTNGSLLEGIALKEAIVLRPSTLKVGTTLLKIDISVSRSDATEVESFGPMSSRNPKLRALLGLLPKVSATDSTVLLQGETGTGKDLLAHAIHQASERRAGPFVVLDCAAVAEGLVESELFGHRAGAFTGASAARPGAFLEANGGTLFLDEIGELPLALQPKLLRALEGQRIKAVGDDLYRTVDVRIIAATHRDLAAWARESRFRPDLYYRLAVVQLDLPPLRARPEDLELVIQRLLEARGQGHVSLSGELLSRFRRHTWPGNVRELRNAIDCELAGGTWEPLAMPPPDSAGLGQAAEVPFKEAKDRLLTSFTRAYLQTMLDRYEGNVARIAEAAGITPFYVRQLLRKHNFRDPPEER